eukprot:gene20663-27449_t
MVLPFPGKQHSAEEPASPLGSASHSSGNVLPEAKMDAPSLSNSSYIIGIDSEGLQGSHTSASSTLASVSSAVALNPMRARRRSILMADDSRACAVRSSSSSNLEWGTGNPIIPKVPSSNRFRGPPTASSSAGKLLRPLTTPPPLHPIPIPPPSPPRSSNLEWGTDNPIIPKVPSSNRFRGPQTASSSAGKLLRPLTTQQMEAITMADHSQGDVSSYGTSPVLLDSPRGIRLNTEPSLGAMSSSWSLQADMDELDQEPSTRPGRANSGPGLASPRQGMAIPKTRHGQSRTNLIAESGPISPTPPKSPWTGSKSSPSNIQVCLALELGQG